jgi:threonylcarbamoyladenosine tRNA methylthiotransferase MtaB
MTFNTLSLGCKVNEYEIDAVDELLINNGYSKSNNPDIFIINTCSVTSVADQKSRQMIRRIRKNNKELKCLVVMGCYSQNNSVFISNELGADVVIGTKYRNLIPSLISKFMQEHTPIRMIDEKVRQFDYENFEVTPHISKTRAYVKIQDGCDNFCSYCVIPYTRGRSRSRDANEIICEIKELVKNGFKEVVLAGIHTAGYGKDLANFTFSDLVEKIVIEVPTLYRLRISSIEESEIDDKLISLLGKYPQIANHLHIPTQSGSSTVLKRMHRKYNVDDFYAKINKIRKVRPDIAITTDVIVGFPGETEKEFEETFEFIKQINFAELHVFPFSSREHTLAATMPNQISPSLKKERVSRLINLSNELWNKYKLMFKGQKIEFLMEDFDSNTNLWRGHSSNYLPIEVKSNATLHDKIINIIY